MLAEIDRRLESLIAIYYDLKRAERSQDSAQVRDKLSEGLQESCLLLRNLSQVCAMKSIRGPSGSQQAFQILHGLHDPEEMHDFLEIERKLLDSTSLTNPTKDEVIRTLSELIPRIAAGQAVTMPGRTALRSLASDVCREARSRQVSWKRHMPFLRRAIFAGAGGVVIVLDAQAAAASAIPTPAVGFATISINAGWWMVKFAASGQLDDWLFRRE